MSIPVLPDWTRWSWASQTERDYYYPLFQEATTAFVELEKLSVIEGLRPATWQFVSPEDLPRQTQWCVDHNLILVTTDTTLRSTDTYSSTGTPTNGVLSHRCLFVRPESYQNVVPFFTRDNNGMGDLLGFPTCCRKHFDETWGKGLVDSTWEQVANTRMFPSAASTLWRFMGLRLVPHLPCAFDCYESVQQAEAFWNLGVQHGYAEQVEFIEEVLHWNVEGSRLFGIAEYVAPCIKISTRTNWTPTKETFSIPGRYRKPETHWWTDNGFSSASGMRQTHNAMLNVLRSVPAGARVLDLGSGNGLLLRRLAQMRPDVLVGGVEQDADVVSRIPAHTGAWWVGKIQDVQWQGWTPDVVLLMPGRLLEMTEIERAGVLARLAQVPTLYTYLYSDWQGQTLESICAQVGLPLERVLTRVPGLTIAKNRGV